jgi:putative transcriptional regulator
MKPAMRKKTVFHELLASLHVARERARSAARAARFTARSIKRLRGSTRLSQPEFAVLLGVELSTLRNWEQGRREPTGPARALLRAIRNDPENVIRALARAA